MSSVARVTEITARGSDYQSAIQAGIDRANKTLRGVQHVYVKDHEIYLEDGTVTEHQVDLKVTFTLDD
ncbi:dodecin family protein [Euzebya sp.]|uniref:dodecin family protein n=1 Tax=Euzebya sp. TaxID=1971409 RepID=UPI003515F399